MTGSSAIGQRPLSNWKPSYSISMMRKWSIHRCNFGHRKSKVVSNIPIDSFD
eukprot:Awhi_evm2s2908